LCCDSQQKILEIRHFLTRERCLRRLQVIPMKRVRVNELLAAVESAGFSVADLPIVGEGAGAGPHRHSESPEALYAEAKCRLQAAESQAARLVPAHMLNSSGQPSTRADALDSAAELKAAQNLVAVCARSLPVGVGQSAEQAFQQGLRELMDAEVQRLETVLADGVYQMKWLQLVRQKVQSKKQRAANRSRMQALRNRSASPNTWQFLKRPQHRLS
jgi:hypothetical protein